MAQKTIVKLVDDLDNQELKDDGQTIRFAFQKHEYEIDLSEQNVQRLQEALAPFIAAGRRVSNRATAADKGDSSQSQAIRQWAKDHGMKVNDRGRVPKEVQEAYRKAN
jgi:nucleoid-associated protein Lsr2